MPGRTPVTAAWPRAQLLLMSCSRTFSFGNYNGGDGTMFPCNALREPAGTGYAGVWQTASMLWPSGSSTNAP